MLITIIVFLIILSVLVIIHELGHFLTAKRLKIRVEEFGFGLPPRAFGIKKGETIYSINWLPIGGFVKLYGEDQAPLRQGSAGQAFFTRPPREKALVVLAGVVMNFLLAIIIFYVFLNISNFKTELPLLDDHRFFFVNQQNTSEIIVSSVSKGSPAEKAGITPFSKIVEVNGEQMNDSVYFINIINKNKGKKITISWQDVKTAKKFKAVVEPRVSPPKNEGAVGVAFFPLAKAVLTYETPGQKVFSGVAHPLNLLAYNLNIIGKLLKLSFAQKSAAPISEGVSGPVGIYSLVGDIVQIPDTKERILGILNLAGILSISLAFFNILPIPALDGGRLFFILIEGVTRRRVHPRFEEYAHAIGMVILLALIALITLHDFTRIFSGKNLLTP